MSTTIELEVDLFVAAESRARQEHRPVKSVINQLLREALASPRSSTSVVSGGTHFMMDSNTGLPVVKGDRAFDLEDVARIEWEFVDLETEPLGVSGQSGRFRDDPTLHEIRGQIYRDRDSERPQ